MTDNGITLALSPHRTECLTLAAERMRWHKTIILEEPEHPLLTGMLEETIPLEEYLEEGNFEFPRFVLRTCRLLRTLYREGKEILQIEPYFEVLYKIHEFFAQGGRPQDIPRGSLAWQVYDAEHRWTAALLEYYERSGSPCFEEVVSAVQAFARADAVRGRLRDRLRAERIARIVPSRRSLYVEAGELHLALYAELKQRLPSGYPLRIVYLMEPVIRALGGRRHAFGPGDILTLLYTFRPDYKGPRADLLAARSLIHVKILFKDEREDEHGRFLHTRNQIESNRIVGDLSYGDCRALYPKIRGCRTGQARRILEEYCQPPHPTT